MRARHKLEISISGDLGAPAIYRPVALSRIWERLC
jgi:hypothetical protein